MGCILVSERKEPDLCFLATALLHNIEMPNINAG